MIKAVFLTTSNKIRGVIARRNSITSSTLDIDPNQIKDVGNGQICSVEGSTHSIMSLIGAIADEGEDYLYRVDPT